MTELPAALRLGLPMLASPSNTIAATLADAVTTLTGRGWLFDVKWDGVRALALAENGTVRLRSRNGEDLTSQFPDVVDTLAAAGLPEPTVLDGELVRFDGERPSFDAAHKRAMQRTPAKAARLARSAPVTFVAFDLPWCRTDLRSRPLRERLAELAALAGAHRLVVSPSHHDGAALLNAVRERGGEGLVAKRPDSAYRSGRSGNWVKLKFTRSLSALVVGHTPGRGARAGTFGALDLALVVPIGKVGSGFGDTELRQIHALLATGELPIVEVAYQGLGPDGKLRFPVFAGLRPDLGAAACTTDQLDA